MKASNWHLVFGETLLKMRKMAAALIHQNSSKNRAKNHTLKNGTCQKAARQNQSRKMGASSLLV